MGQVGKVVQVNVSDGGVPKLPVAEGVVGALGIEGDGHNDPLNHGGPARALCIFAVEKIDALRRDGHPIGPGTTGENITTEGIDWDEVEPGSVFRLGPEVVVQVTRFTTPCLTIRESFNDGNFLRMHQQQNPGYSRVYAGVLEPGIVRPGDTIVAFSPAEVRALIEGQRATSGA